MSTLIKNSKIIFSHEILDNAYLICENEMIKEWGDMSASPLSEKEYDEAIDAEEKYLSPGFVDIQVHGGGGGSTLDGTEESFMKMFRAHLKGGTTTILATICGADSDMIIDNINIFNKIKEDEENLLKNMHSRIEGIPHIPGLHLEGPYFSYEQRGAFDPSTLRVGP